MLPPGIELPRGEKALDQITKTLAEMPPGQLQDVMAGMKVSHRQCILSLVPPVDIGTGSKAGVRSI